MKIIFDNDDEKEMIMRDLYGTDTCPSILGLSMQCKNYTCDEACYRCWERAIDTLELK